MKRLHIAFISHPQYPHVGPTLPIVSVLVRRGYRVTYATSGRFTSRVAELGAEVVPFSAPVYTASDWAAISIESLGDVFFQHAVRVLEQIEPIYESSRPDLVIYDKVAVAGRILATRLAIPMIQTSPTFGHDIQCHAQQVPDAVFRELLIRVGAQFDAAYRKLGIGDANWLFHRDGLNIFLFPRLLQPCGEMLDQTCFFAGRCAGEQPYWGSWRNSVSGTPAVLIATSTHYLRRSEYFKSWISALGGLGWHVLLSIGDQLDPACLQPLPANFEVIQNVSHVSILPHVNLLIFLGGIISSAEALYHGVPMLTTSQGLPEQEWESENLAALNLAVHLQGERMDPQELKSAAIRASSDGLIKAKVQESRRAILKDAGSEETANRIEEFLGI